MNVDLVCDRHLGVYHTKERDVNTWIHYRYKDGTLGSLDVLLTHEEGDTWRATGIQMCLCGRGMTKRAAVDSLRASLAKRLGEFGENIRQKIGSASQETISRWTGDTTYENFGH